MAVLHLVVYSRSRAQCTPFRDPLLPSNILLSLACCFGVCKPARTHPVQDGGQLRRDAQRFGLPAQLRGEPGVQLRRRRRQPSRRIAVEQAPQQVQALSRTLSSTFAAQEVQLAGPLPCLSSRPHCARVASMSYNLTLSPAC